MKNEKLLVSNAHGRVVATYSPPTPVVGFSTQYESEWMEEEEEEE